MTLPTPLLLLLLLLFFLHLHLLVFFFFLSFFRVNSGWVLFGFFFCSHPSSERR